MFVENLLFTYRQSGNNRLNRRSQMHDSLQTFAEFIWFRTASDFCSPESRPCEGSSGFDEGQILGLLESMRIGGAN